MFITKQKPPPENRLPVLTLIRIRETGPRICPRFNAFRQA